MLRLRKVISGGQVGADQGGIMAARALGIETGGSVPKGWRTLDGAAPWLADYGCVCHPSGNYSPRTFANVHAADATARFAYDFGTAGERCTIRAIEKLRRPHLDVDFDRPLPHEDFVRWLIDHKVAVLNVAGNAKAPTAHGPLASSVMRQFVFNYLTQALEGYFRGNAP